jgi:cytochrome c oxidase assembly protein subunit 15
LPTPISVAHACLAQAFLLTVVTIATVTRPSWNELAAIGTRDERARVAARRVRVPALATTAAVYGQLILGALTRHTGAGLAIPDFPLALGRIVPPLADPLVAIQFAHRAGALAVTALVVWTARRALGGRGASTPLRGPAIALLALTGLQVALGATAVWTRLAVLPATAHVTTGATLLATSLILTLRAQRLAPLAPGTEPVLAPLRPVMP